jgi:osmotically-inducible protein OsmY
MRIITSLLIILVSISLTSCGGGGGADNTGNANTGNSNTGNSNTGNSGAETCPNSLSDTPQQSNYQIVYDDCIEWIGNTGSVTVKYNSDSSELTGLGLRIHYDSASMTLVGASNVYNESLISSPETSTTDSEDFDQNSSTDKFLIAAWASINGDWPGKLNQDLASLEFQKIDGGSTNYNLSYSASSVPPGITLNP